MTPDQVRDVMIHALLGARAPSQTIGNNQIGTMMIYGADAISMTFYLDEVPGVPARRVFSLEAEEGIIGG